MSNNLIFRAADTTTALERVQESLGPNAYIIEINNVGNFVEITASLEEPVKRIREKAPKAINPFREVNETVDTTNKENTSLGSVGESKSEVVWQPSQSELPLKNGFIVNADATDEKTKIFQPERHSQKAEKFENKVFDTDFTPDKPLKDTHVSSKKDNPKTNVNISENAKSTYKKSYELGFGDLLNLGLSGDFIKKQFAIEEFAGGISKVEMVQSLIDAFYDPREKAIFEDYSNLIFLGTPGSGKSTICAKLMHFFGTQYTRKPTVVHVTPEKLFEADRLSFHAKMFNFPFKRSHLLDNEKLFQADSQLIEIAWDFQIPFANFYSKNRHLYPKLKPFIVLPAEINNDTLSQIIRVCPNIRSIILNKCDYGRFSGKNLMMLYQHGCKISVLSGNRSVKDALDIADEAMMRGFLEFTLRL